MRRKLLSLCMTVLLIMSPFVTFAQAEGFSGVTIDYVRSSGSVTISGSAGFVDNLKEPIRLMILKPDPVGQDAVSNIDALIAGDVSLFDVCIHIDETMMTEDKKFVFKSFVLPENLAAGEYVIRLAAQTTEYTKTFSVASVSQAIDIISNVEDSDEVLAYIEKYNDVYQLNIAKGSDYQKLEEKGKEYVLANMCSKDYKDVEDIQKTFNTFVQLYRIYMGPWGTLEEIIDNHDVLLGITSYLSDFNDLSQAKKDTVYKELSGILYSDAEEFAESFDEAVTKALSQTESDRREPSSSGGGGSGRVTASITAPVATKEPDIPTQKPDEESERIPFNDLTNHGWAEESILKLYNKGIINGKGNGKFAPNDFVTRAEAVKMILLAFDIADGSAKCNFEDVSENSWYYSYIAKASEMEIIFGYDNGTVGAESPITREDFAVIIARALSKMGVQLSEVEENSEFADSDNIAEYAKEAVKILQQADILNGTDENKFMPKKTTTRAEAAKVIAALLD